MPISRYIITLISEDKLVRPAILTVRHVKSLTFLRIEKEQNRLKDVMIRIYTYY